MDEVKRSRLDNEGISYRKDNVDSGAMNAYAPLEGRVYDANHEDARHHNDELHPWGKGTGTPLGYAVRDLSAPKTRINYSSLITKDAGGSYDIYGRPDQVGGRNYLMTKNIYTPEKQYGVDSVDIDINLRGQYFEKTNQANALFRNR